MSQRAAILATIWLVLLTGLLSAQEPPASEREAELRPQVLNPAEQDFIPLPEYAESPESVFLTPPLRQPGFTGRSGIRLSEESAFDWDEWGNDFLPRTDRWRLGMPAWDRYGKGHPFLEESPYVEGNWWDPYHQNVLKGDFPIIGQHTFLNLTISDQQIFEGRQVPTPTTPFESTAHPDEQPFFGDPDQYFYNHNLFFSVELNHGDGAFKPADWRLKLTQAFNMNHLVVDELAVVNHDVRKGTSRFRTDYALEEWFLETKLADLGPEYDFMSVRAGSQFFSSDFRGLLFSDTNRAVRLFGTRSGNRDQFNLVFVDQTEKETNSGLNTFADRQQNTVIANYYRQDFLFPGLTVEASYHFNRDQATFLFDKNDFLARPDPVGIYAPHEVKAHYLGVAKIGRAHV